jgi:hypothetical protein
MMRIKRLNCFDIPKIQRMTEYLDSEDNSGITKDLKNEVVRVLIEHGDNTVNQTIILILFHLKPKFV